MPQFNFNIFIAFNKLFSTFFFIHLIYVVRSSVMREVVCDMDNGLTLNKKYDIIIYAIDNEDMIQVKTEIIVMKSFMIEQLHLMKTSL